MPLCLTESYFVVAFCENFTYLRVLINTLLVIALQCSSALFCEWQWAVSGPGTVVGTRWALGCLRLTAEFRGDLSWVCFVAPSKSINT